MVGGCRRVRAHLPAVSMASLFGGGTVKQTEGTMASLPLGLMTFHLVRWELSSSTHSSPLVMVIWETGERGSRVAERDRERG